VTNIAIIQEVNTNTDSTSITNVPQAITATAIGNYLVCSLINNNNNAPQGIIDTFSGGLSWSAPVTVADTSASRQVTYWIAKNTVGGNATVTAEMDFASTQHGIVLAEIGPCTASAVDGQNTADQPTPGTGTNAITVSATNAHQPALIYGLCYCGNAGGTLNAGTGFTASTTVNGSVSLGGILTSQSKRITTTGSQTATWTTSVASPALSILIMLDEAASGGHRLLLLGNSGGF
jgi:hypothetical protein